MKRIFFKTAGMAAIALLTAQTSTHASAQEAQAYTVIANPGEDAARQARINWHADDAGLNTITYTEAADTDWSHGRTITAFGERVTVFDSIPSKLPDGSDFTEYPHFVRYVAQLNGLEPSTDYMYRIGDGERVRHFRTGPLPGHDWTAAVIADFHTYSPLPNRKAAAMRMLDTLAGKLAADNGKTFDIVLHIGDITAWGGSYSFWRQLYDEPWIADNLVAGVLGNHDNMTRCNNRPMADGTPAPRNTNRFFRNTNANPENSYGDNLGVSYWFRYGDVMFFMLNSMSMHSEEGMAEAQAWMREVLAQNPSEKIVVIEHYPWFLGADGKNFRYERWKDFFDEYGVDIAICGHNHAFLRTYPLKGDEVVAPGEGTYYVQAPSSDAERGEGIDELTLNVEKIATRWTEGGDTVGAMILKYKDGNFSITVYDRNGNIIDAF